MDEKENTRELVVVEVKRYKKVKRALLESEERYRQLFENVPIGIYRTTPDGRIVDSNPALVQMLGYDSFAELATRNLEKDSRHTEYRRADFVKRLKRDGEIKGLESVWYKKDGTMIHVRENAKLVSNEDNQVFFEGTVEDISFSKKAEEMQRIRTQQIEILNCIISKGNMAESLTDMLEVILDCVTQPLDLDTTAIFILDPLGEKMNLLTSRGVKKNFHLKKEFMLTKNLPFSKVLRGESVFVDHALKTVPDLAKPLGLRIAASIPLVSKGRVIGALNVGSCKRSAFSPEEKNILEMIGKEAGTLISKLQTETALRESEKYYRSLIDTSPDIIAVTDLDGNLQMVNQRFVNLSGYFFDEIIGRNSFDFVTDFDHEIFLQNIKKFTKNGKLTILEYSFKKKNGDLVPIELSASLRFDAAGTPCGLIGYGRDISERKRAELNIAEKNKVLSTLNEISLDLAMMPPAADINEYISEKLMSLTKAIYVGINQYNKDTRQLEFISAKTNSKILTEVNKILGKNVRNIKYDVSKAKYKEITSEIVGYRSTLHEASFGAITEKASSIVQHLFNIDHFIGMALVVENELIGTVIMAVAKGTPAVSIELLKSFSHITSVSLRRRRAESQLVTSEEKFKKLFYISPDSFILSHLDDGRIVSVNKGFTKIFGYEENEVVGKTNTEINIYKNPGEHEGIIDALRTGGAAENIEYWFVSKSGENILGLVSAAIIDVNDEKYILHTIRDISERKRAEQELKESKALIDAVVENVPLMIFIKEAKDLRFVVFNHAGEELLGYDRKSLLGKNNLDLFPPEQAAFFMAKDREVLAGEANMLDIPEEPIMTAKKGQRLLHTRKVCIRGSDGITKYLLGISEDITERKEAEAKLLAYQEQLRALTSELTLIEEKERRRIASELHDQIGQNLALCKLKVAALENNLTDSALKNEMSAVRRLLECSIQDARSLIFDLSPPVLYELGFKAALEWLAERIQEQFHVPIEFESRFDDPELDDDRQVILFQVIRELLVNVGKHSRASQAKVILSFEAPFLKVQVNDDGVGFDASTIFNPREQNGGFGFFSMRERLSYLGGGLEVKSKPGKGSQIILTMPPHGCAAVAKGKNP
ncbi:MAG TPA: PAS domain S-box protein [Patescibacteria group bacterium]|nr:PAS domain S-box protein [Patescibacteria group bacterium]